MVYDPLHTVARGDEITLTGTVSEYYGMTEVKDKFKWVSIIGIEEKEPISHLKVLLHSIPNLVKGKIELSYFLPCDSKLRICLYDVMGRLGKILEKGNGEENWHKTGCTVSSIPDGIYFILFEDENSKTIISKKVCIIR